jgi:lipoyl(octanoyl) transferase
MAIDVLYVRSLASQDYQSCWQAMLNFTQIRQEETPDEIWLLEHPPVYTQGQNGRPEHILNAAAVPVIQTDRGGQVTYHGPGQLICYTLIDLKRKKINIRQFVRLLEQSVIDLLVNYAIPAYGKCEAPGIYIKSATGEKKIASLGLRVKRGCTYHGLALNVEMDLTPFTTIHPCGFTALQMTQLVECQPSQAGIDRMVIGRQLIDQLIKHLQYLQVCYV